MEQKILLQGAKWMIWYWPYWVKHPKWGRHDGLDGISHSFFIWFIQVWWTTRKEGTR